MGTMASPIDLETRNETRKDHFVVVHPLDDVPETKVDTEALGPMAMTRTVRFSLLSLRAYLILMVLLVVYHVVMLAR
ncbi:MAG: hypothetical protein ABSH32_14005 [Bryobacteraceae bacterium]|jgi:hypothetical protein